MKQNRFADMVPPTPDDFHASVLDALYRLDRKPTRHYGTLKLAASLVVLIAASAMLMLLFQNRPSQPDTVLMPDESEFLPAPSEAPAETPLPYDDGILLEILDAGIRGDSAAFEWKLTGPADETLLLATDCAVVESGVKAELLTFSNQLYLVGSATSSLAVLENGEFSALQLFDSVLPFSGPISVLLRFSVFRPTAELVEYDDMIDDVFENSPKWLLFRNTSDSPNENGHTLAMAVDYNGRNYKIPYGSAALEELDAQFYNTYFDRDPQTEAELDEYLRLHSNFRHVMLDMYGFAERLAEFEVRIDYDLETTLAAVSIARIS